MASNTTTPLVPTEPPSDADFATILRHSILRPTTHKATCQTCKRFASFESQRSIRTKDLPPILAVNANVFTEETHKFWMDSKGQTFLKPTVSLCGQLEGVDDPEEAVYELRNISEEDALRFPGSWKVPAILYFERVDRCDQLDYSGLPDHIDQSILCRDTNIAQSRDKRLIKHETLRPEELPKPGMLVAIDAEFVSMQQEDTEYRSDGTKKVLRPARLSLARVSVLRGEGPKEGVPFIDDHIHTSDVIVDYLTEYYGIRFGDLDPHLTRYTLTPLKLAYKKLRLLVDLGCIFIGHGISKDFRIISEFLESNL
ncbi:hypothetical protein WOLCODRAFT_15157 [Wolfiporia cocos MD-104 SS10]|uniref:Exonuclease domain-containing protein n=1 Tax=Wolfiporia cocos (strain MD-104) TaxID=742152 RepID=A0A2H3J603_WOLCO|nr:hypothetical protein WOLCODRAFT_15157 [Wolfiporia cocos MD-104 SS10]